MSDQKQEEEKQQLREEISAEKFDKKWDELDTQEVH